jgi:hypothetical protein
VATRGDGIESNLYRGRVKVAGQGVKYEYLGSPLVGSFTFISFVLSLNVASLFISACSS